MAPERLLVEIKELYKDLPPCFMIPHEVYEAYHKKALRNV
jgi:hypothetical protein